MLVGLLLLGGSSLTTWLYYDKARDEVHRNIIEQGLPLTGDTIFSEVNKDILRPVFISSLMAHDTFVRDWLISGEKDSREIARYLQEIRLKYNTVSSFLVSDQSRNYYYGNGILKQVLDHEPRDVWYQRVRRMGHDYEINVDVDMANSDEPTVFINHRIVDFKGRYIGATGVGLTLDKLSGLIANYELRFDRHIYFADGQGRIVLASNKQRSLRSSLHEIPGLAPLLPQILKRDTQSRHLSYQHAGNTILLNARYIRDLDWYLLVEQDETAALRPVEQALWTNLLISATIMLLVTGLVLASISHNQKKLHRMARTDQLTGALNRHAFAELWQNKLQKKASALLMLDIDHFKAINDQYGHHEGDRVLQSIANRLQDHLLPADKLVRWGGEEFAVVLRAGLGEEGCLAQAESLRIAIHELNDSTLKQMPTVSIGLSMVQADDTLESLSARADEALYRAKQAGRNRVQRYEEMS